MAEPRDRFQGPLVPWLKDIGKGWHGDVDARWRGWYVLKKDKLYYDPKTQSFYDYDHERVRPEAVREMGIDPNNPLATAGAARTQYATDVLNRTTQGETVATGAGEGMPIVKVPNKLVQMPDGSYADYNGMPVDPAVAQRMLNEYEQSSYPDRRDEVAQFQEMNRQLGQERQSRLGTEAMSRLWSRQLTEARGGKLSDEQKAKVFESARGQLLAGLDPIVDAFQYWTIANKDNKWARKIQEGRSEMSPAERAEKWELEVEKARTRFKKVNELRKAASDDPGRKLSLGEQQEYELASLHLTNALQESVQADKVLAGEANYYDRNFASDAPTWERDPQTGEKIGDPHYGGIVGQGTSQSAKRRPWRTPETPPAPEWLARQFPEATQAISPDKYALGGTSALRAIKMTGLTPSAQSWARMLPSEQAGFMSHTRWSGGVPEDTLGRMQAMLPGARTGSRWQPYRR